MLFFVAETMEEGSEPSSASKDKSSIKTINGEGACASVHNKNGESGKSSQTTNKKKGTPMLGSKDHTVLKPMRDDPENPFGAVVKQKLFKDPKTGKKELSALNIVNEEGKWDSWSQRAMNVPSRCRFFRRVA